MDPYTQKFGGLAALLLSCGLASAQLLVEADPAATPGATTPSTPSGCCDGNCAGACGEDCCKHEGADGAHVCDENCLQACCVDLTSLIHGYRAPTLTVGDEAPPLYLSEFYKGEAFTSFEKGRVYIVEFWATWCKPCIDAMPHLSQLQKEHADDLTVIGVNISEQMRGGTPATIPARVRSFVENQGDRMAYTVAGGELRPGEQLGAMEREWQMAAGRTTIPSSYIIDRDGTIAWIGSPQLGMDNALEEILAGTYSREKAKRDALFQSVAPLAFRQFINGVTSPSQDQADEAYELGRVMAAQVLQEQPNILQSMARVVLENPQVQHRDIDFGLDLAHKAVIASKWKDAASLDAYARGLFLTGDVMGAIDAQEKALDVLEGNQGRSYLQKRLEEYRQAAPLVPPSRD
ncbi:MAG: redoxin family protein [Phycisphaerales bacterium]